MSTTPIGTPSASHIECNPNNLSVLTGAGRLVGLRWNLHLHPERISSINAKNKVAIEDLSDRTAESDVSRWRRHLISVLPYMGNISKLHQKVCLFDIAIHTYTFVGMKYVRSDSTGPISSSDADSWIMIDHWRQMKRSK